MLNSDKGLELEWEAQLGVSTAARSPPCWKMGAAAQPQSLRDLCTRPRPRLGPSILWREGWLPSRAGTASFDK